MLTEIAVVVPVYNNQSSLRKLNSRISTSLKAFNYEIVYVNDCSKDDSLNILKSLSKADSHIKLVNLETNIGQQRATLFGLKATDAMKVVVMDADLQDKPELIPEMYNLCKNSTTTTFIKRVGKYQSNGRMITSFVVKNLIQLISGLHRKAGSYYMIDHKIKSKVVLLAAECRTPYLSIIVSSCSPGRTYIRSLRKISEYGSNYTLSTRLKAAKDGITCAIFCFFRT